MVYENFPEYVSDHFCLYVTSDDLDWDALKLKDTLSTVYFMSRLSDFPVFLMDVFKDTELLNIIIESGVLSGSTRISSPEKYFGRL